jgi:cyanate permease
MTRHGPDVVTTVTARVHYAWVVAGVAFLSLVMASGFRSTTGVLLIPLHDEFGWSHETIGLAVSLNLLCFGLGAPFAAALIERFGVRRVVVPLIRRAGRGVETPLPVPMS